MRSAPNISPETQTVQAAAPQVSALPRISLTPDDAAVATGFSRRRIFDAISKNELTARKHGKSTVIEIAELKRWVGSLPTRGRCQILASA
jgi:hypothetical protein